MTDLELVALPNGVRIALDPMPGLETASLGVWIRVGARMEAPEENGIAHLFEHMAFKGAGGRDARAFAEAIENVGGFMNAATGFERTSYTARTLAEHAAFALDLCADMIVAPHWRAEDLELEKGVVEQERGEAYDQPDDYVFELHQAAVFPGQALGRPILGTKDTVAAVTPESLAAFRDAHMTPDRVVIVAAGGYDRTAILECAERRFGDLRSRPASAPAEARASQAGVREERKLEQTHLVFSAGGAPAGSEASYAGLVFSEIFGGGMASRLFQEVRERRGLVYTVNSFLDSYEDVGRIGVYAGCAAKQAKEVANCVADILMALAADGPTEEEMARAKAVVTASTLMGAEQPSSRAESRASQVFLRGKLLPYAELRARLNAVTGADVQSFARAALQGPIAAAALGPKSGLGAADAFRARLADGVPAVQS